MPWHLPAELGYFKRVTSGHPIVMGRKTFESIGRPLPNRTNVVVTRNPAYAPEGCLVVHSIEEVIERLGGQPFFVIGGAQIYRAFLPFADRLFVTKIEHAFDGDEYFPPVDWSKWQLVSEEQGLTDERNPYTYRYQVFERLA